MTTEKKNIIDCIKTFEDALQATGRPACPDFLNVPEDLRPYFEAQYKMVIITEALNEVWEPNWSDHNQQKWFPWFEHSDKSSSGFAFYGALYRCSDALAGDGSRLCFKSDELARYAGQQFIEIWNKILLK